MSGTFYERVHVAIRAGLSGVVDHSDYQYMSTFNYICEKVALLYTLLKFVADMLSNIRSASSCAQLLSIAFRVLSVAVPVVRTRPVLVKSSPQYPWPTLPASTAHPKA